MYRRDFIRGAGAAVVSTAFGRAAHATAAEPFTAAAVLFAIVSGVLSYEGARAYKRIRGLPSDEKLHADAVRVLAEIIRNEIQKDSLGKARSHLQNSMRQLEYYINNPRERGSSLHDAEVESGYAIEEFKRMGFQGAHSFLISTSVHMSILQEREKVSESPSAEHKNMKSLFDATKKHLDSAFAKPLEELLAAFKKRNESSKPVPGTLVIPTGEEMTYKSLLDATYSTIDKLRIASHVVGRARSIKNLLHKQYLVALLREKKVALRDSDGVGWVIRQTKGETFQCEWEKADGGAYLDVDGRTEGVLLWDRPARGARWSIRFSPSQASFAIENDFNGRYLDSNRDKSVVGTEVTALNSEKLPKFNQYRGAYWEFSSA